MRKICVLKQLCRTPDVLLSRSTDLVLNNFQQMHQQLREDEAVVNHTDDFVSCRLVSRVSVNVYDCVQQGR